MRCAVGSRGSDPSIPAMATCNNQGHFDPRVSRNPQNPTLPRQIIQVLIPRPTEVLHANNTAYSASQDIKPDRNVLQKQAPHARQIGPQAPRHISITGHRDSYLKHGGATSRLSAPPIDYQTMMLSLAEEYFCAAYERTLGQKQSQADIYYKFIATGLGCLEAVLRQFKMQPKVEARTRLRYASVLHQETENFMEAEEALSKGIVICERHRFLDLKYNMQHLLARIMSATSSKAGLRYLDSVIKDVEAYHHITWIYAFRFLRASLSIPSLQESLAAINHFKAIGTLASSQRDSAVAAVASTMEALTHLHRSRSAESIEQAQQALTIARSFQIDMVSHGMPHLSIMMHFVDICSTLLQFDPGHAVIKMQYMQAMLDSLLADPRWAQKWHFPIPVKTNPTNYSSTCEPIGGVFELNTEGELNLLLHWLPKEETYALGYLLSGMVVGYRNASDGHISEKYLKEGLRAIAAMPEPSAGLSAISTSQIRWRQLLLSHIQLTLVFVLCARTQWTAAQDQLERLKQSMADLPEEAIESNEIFVLYLEGLICQGTGDISTALSIFQGPLFTLLTPDDTKQRSQIHRDLSILSALNTLLIIRSPSHPSHHLSNEILSALEPIATSNPSKIIHAAYNLIRATAHPDDATGIVKTKRYMQAALQAAKSCANNQLMCITLNFMSWKFFHGVVAEQAEKSARASVTLAKKGRDRLWTSVADAILADTLDVRGKGPEAEAVRREGREIAASLPVSMQKEVDMDGIGPGYAKDENCMS